MFELKIVGSTMGELKTQLQACYLSLLEEEKKAEAVVEEAPVKKKKAKKKAAPKLETVEKVEKPLPREKEEAEPVVVKSGATLQQAKAVMTVVVKKFGIPTALKLLGKYDAKKISELSEASYSDFVNDCVEALNV